MPEEIWILLLVVAVLLAIALAIRLIVWAFVGAIVILEFAGVQGFLGLAAYVACWVFLFPVMLTISIIVGALVTFFGDEGRQRGVGGFWANLRWRKERRVRARQLKMRKQLGYDD